MLRTTAAMLPSASSLRSLLRLSRRAPLHRLRPLPSPPLLLPHLRLLSSSSSSSTSGGNGWEDLLGPLEAVSSASAAAASDPETPADSEGSWGVFDPVAGRIVMQAQPSPPPSSSDGEEEEEEVKQKGKPIGWKGERRWADVATARRAAGKAGKAARATYVCSNCGDGFSQWWGTCRSCKAVGTLTKYLPGADSADDQGSHHAGRSWIPQKSKEMVPKSLGEVTKGFDQEGWRIPLPGSFGNEVARVLGGGVVPGSLVLVGGDPGVGKSSLMLQLASIVSDGSEDHGSSPVVYVSGEESIEQIANRADRMSIRSKDLYLYSSTDIESTGPSLSLIRELPHHLIKLLSTDGVDEPDETATPGFFLACGHVADHVTPPRVHRDILDKIQPLSPRALIVDSIQTVYLTAFAGSAGNQVQVKECTSALLSFAKLTNIPVFLIGHVTKTGDIAGPRILEHIVDVVLYMEGERCLSHRLLRPVKNRFGSTDELGVFEMSESGLQAVLNPSEMFLTEHASDSEILAGLAVAVVLDGSRTFAIEVQALCVPSSRTRGQVVGIPVSRADVIISVLMKQAGLKLQDNVIFLNVVSGFELTETAGDLAIAASICSSFLEFPIPNDIAFIGEIGLGGEIRTVPRMDKRVMAIAKLGYRKCVVPKNSEKLLKPLNLGGIQILPCNNLKEFINTVFRPEG